MRLLRQISELSCVILKQKETFTRQRKKLSASGGYNCNTREHKLKGKAQYSLPPCACRFRSAAFDIENIIYFLSKLLTPLKRLTLQSLHLQLVLPGNTA